MKINNNLITVKINNVTKQSHTDIKKEHQSKSSINLKISTSDIDRRKVDYLKRLILSGEYIINYEKIAENLIKNQIENH